MPHLDRDGVNVYYTDRCVLASHALLSPDADRLTRTVCLTADRRSLGLLRGGGDIAAGGGGQPILFTHGFSASSAMWDVQQPLVQQGFRVIAWDIRGH